MIADITVQHCFSLARKCFKEVSWLTILQSDHLTLAKYGFSWENYGMCVFEENIKLFSNIILSLTVILL